MMGDAMLGLKTAANQFASLGSHRGIVVEPPGFLAVFSRLSAS